MTDETMHAELVNEATRKTLTKTYNENARAVWNGAAWTALFGLIVFSQTVDFKYRIWHPEITRGACVTTQADAQILAQDLNQAQYTVTINEGGVTQCLQDRNNRELWGDAIYGGGSVIGAVWMGATALGAYRKKKDMQRTYPGIAQAAKLKQ